MTKKIYYIVAIVMVTLLTTGLHFTTMRGYSPHVVLEELYYLPLLLGVLRFGVYGAVLTWLFVSAAYLPFFFSPWTMSVAGSVDRFLHLSLSGVVVFVVGLLVERERRQSEQVQRDRYLAGIGQVATVIVHDLKNPLMSILGFTRRIREGKGDVALAAQTIEDSAQNMQKIVSSVLDFAKPLHLNRKDDDIRDTLRRAGESCRTKAEVKGVTLSMHLPSAPLITAIDSVQIERALINLIDNAVDASPQGVPVSVTAATDRKEIVITIKDQGSGMDSETLANLFMPFYTTKNEGTGLGMPISKKVIEAHAGTLAITSKQGVGTEAKIRLPYKNRPEPIRLAKRMLRCQDTTCLRTTASWSCPEIPSDGLPARFC